MAWVKIDDQFPGHPKVGMLAPAWRPLAVFLHINGLCWCNQYLTDGRIPKAILSRLGSEVECLEIQAQGLITAQRVADELVAVGLWEEDEDHYIIHDFSEFQPSRREVQARRRHVQAVRSDAGSKGASKRAANRQANVQQTGKQTCSPDPDPDPDPLPQDHEHTSAPAAPVCVAASPTEDLLEHWRAVAAQHGVLEPAATSQKVEHQARALLAVHALDVLRRAVTAFWASPRFIDARNFGLFAHNAGQLVAHVQAGHAHRFGDRAPARATLATCGTPWCAHDPPCQTQAQHLLRDLDAQRAAAGIAPRGSAPAARATSSGSSTAVA